MCPGGGGGRGKVVSQETSSLFILSTLSYATLPRPLRAGVRARFRVPIWTQTETNWDRRRGTDDEMSSSDDITSLVPCLAVKGTNLMISRVGGGGGAGQMGLENVANGVKCLFLYSSFFIGTNQSVAAWTEQVRQKAASPDRCLTSVVSRKSQWLDASTTMTCLNIQNVRQRILMQCNKVVCLSVCLWAEWECMWTYIRRGRGGRGGETDGRRKWRGSG